MRITPITDQQAEAQAQSVGLWPNGDVDYEVRDASEETSSAGNDMIKMEVWVFNKSGSRRLIFDYLVNSEKTAWKIRHFVESCGMIAQYESGNLIAPEIIGRTGRCTISIQPARQGYEARNVIRDYLKAAAADAPKQRAPAASRQKAPAGDIDDEIPF